MTPEKLNRLAMWGTIAILVVAGAVFGVRRAVGDPANSSVGPPVAVSVAFESPSIGLVPATTPTSEHAAEEGIDTTVARSGSLVLSLASQLIGSGAPHSTTTTSAATSTTAAVFAKSVTTTVPTTTTTVPTTTTTVPKQGLFVDGFGGQAQGDDDDWSVRLSVDLDATVNGTWRAQVYVSWSGDSSGGTVIDAGGSGKASAVVGPFSGSSVVFTITDVRSAGWLYLPELNRAATVLTVLTPED